MEPFATFALAAALVSGALALLHGLVWRAQRAPWSAFFAIAYALVATIYTFDAQLQPQAGQPHPVASMIGLAAGVLMTLGMVDYVGCRGRSARVIGAAAIGLALAMVALLAGRLVSRLVGFGVLSTYLVGQAALALYAMRREPRRGHGLVAIALLSYPAVIAAAALGVYDISLLRYAVAVPTSVMGMTVLTTGLLRAQQVAGEELAARQRAQTELRQLNEALEQRVLQRTEALHGVISALESFNRSISHDLRGPLGGIAGASRLATEALEAGDTATALRMLPVVTRQAEVSAELVDKLLELARVDDATLQPRPVPLAEVVDDSLAQLRLAEGERPLPVHVGPLPTLAVDPALMRQVFVNLIGNALKFSRTSAAPRVEVGAREQAGHPVLFVRDNGVGFDAQAAEAIFEPFRRLHAGTHAGHGVGLSIVQRIVERHGGQVWAESAPGAGATFYVQLGAPAV